MYTRGIPLVHTDPPAALAPARPLQSCPLNPHTHNSNIAGCIHTDTCYSLVRQAVAMAVAGAGQASRGSLSIAALFEFSRPRQHSTLARHSHATQGPAALHSLSTSSAHNATRHASRHHACWGPECTVHKKAVQRQAAPQQPQAPQQWLRPPCQQGRRLQQQQQPLLRPQCSAGPR